MQVSMRMCTLEQQPKVTTEWQAEEAYNKARSRALKMTVKQQMAMQISEMLAEEAQFMPSAAERLKIHIEAEEKKRAERLKRVVARGPDGAGPVGTAFDKTLDACIGSATSTRSIVTLASALSAGALPALRRLRVRMSPDSDIAHYAALVGAFGSAGCRCASALRSFSLRGSPGGDDIAPPIVAALAHLPALRELDLAECQLGSRGVMAIARGLAGVQSRGGSRVLPQLRWLWLRGNGGAAGAGRVLHELAASRGTCARITRLELGGNGMGSREGKLLGNLIASGSSAARHLRWLNLSHNPGVADSLGAALLAARTAATASRHAGARVPPGPPPLCALVLAGVALEHGAAVTLLRALRTTCASLTLLDLSHNGLKAGAFEELANTLVAPAGLNSLRVLRLSNNQSGINGVPVLVRALEEGECTASDSMRELDLTAIGMGLQGCLDLSMALIRGVLPKLVRLCIGLNSAAGTPEMNGRYKDIARRRKYLLHVEGLEDDILGRYII
eukprot:g3852.t1